jgi:hypothetical protein
VGSTGTTAAPDPTVVGESVLVVPVLNVTDSGVREWELRAVAPGTTTVTGRDPDYTLTITVSCGAHLGCRA